MSSPAADYLRYIPDEVDYLGERCKGLDRLIHAYFGVVYDLVWDVVINKVPQLGEEIRGLLAQEE